MSYLTAPPRTPVHVVTSVYGTLSGKLNMSRVRLWILLADADPARPFVRICRNDSKTGAPVWHDLGMVERAQVVGKRISIQLQGDESLTFVEAPCVCGAGAAGMAGPIDGRYEEIRVRTDQLDWLDQGLARA